MSNSLRSDFFSISSPCSFKKVHRNKLRFCMKFCSSLLPCLYASFMFVLTGSIARNWCIVRVNSWTNCSSYCVTWTPAEMKQASLVQDEITHWWMSKTTRDVTITLWNHQFMVFFFHIVKILKSPNIWKGANVCMSSLWTFLCPIRFRVKTKHIEYLTD